MRQDWADAIEAADEALASFFVYRLGLHDPEMLNADDTLQIRLPARATYTLDEFTPTVTEHRPIAVYVLYG